jgi:hypothetical protein
MSKLKFISIIAIGLLISNILLIGVLVFKKPPLPPHLKPRAIVIERLNLDKEQVKQYDELIQWHRSEINNKEATIIELKNKLYVGIIDVNSKGFNDSIATEIGKLQVDIEHIHYKHFEDIGALCNASQKSKFDALIKEIAGVFARPKPKGKP